jgi:exopolyphosphatase/guanosine-5'-triphosphate,3'-diphosphate pyrophosphatase
MQPDGDSPQPPVVPRWEWRTFGDEFGEAEPRLAALTPERAQDSDEIYLLSAHSDASVKVREGLLDVKHLERVNDDGLELWIPRMKAPFPLSADDVATVLSTLAVAMPPLTREAYTQAEFARELVAPEPGLLAARVHKRRVHYLVDGCMVELTELGTDRGVVRTLAIESADPALVRTIIDRLGLGGRSNVNMARGLKAFLRFGAQRWAVVDVGTNSVKFFVGELQADGDIRTIADRAEITRLGEGVDEHGRLAEDAMERTLAAIASMADEARREGATEIAAVGTAVLRVAANRDAFEERLRTRLGIRIDAISGDDEARLAYRAATSSLPVGRGPLVVFDSGGGSTQFTFGHGVDVEERFSVDIGAVRIAERCGLTDAITDDVLEAALGEISTELRALDGREPPDAVIAMGGTVTNLAAVTHQLTEYDPEVVRGTVLDVAEIDRQIDLYRTRNVEQRRRIAGLQAKRADVILAGACIVRVILTKLERDSLVVTDRGLRHGLFFERFVH